MTFVKKIHRGIAAEIFTFTLIIMAALSSVIFVFRLLGYAEYVFLSKDGPISVLMFVVFLLPEVFKVTIPVSLLVGATIAAIRMSHDRELEAWMSCGVSAIRLNVAPAVLGIFISGVALFSALWLEPFSRAELRKFKWMHARRSIETIIESRLHPKTFLSNLFSATDTDISMYFDWISETKKEFKGVFIAFRSKRDRYTTVLVGNSGSLKKETRNGVGDYVFTVREGRYYQAEANQNTSYLELAKQFPNQIDVSQLPQEIISGNKTLAFPPPVGWTIVEFKDLEVSLLNMFQKQFSPGEFDADDIRSMYPVPYVTELRKIRQNPEWRKNNHFIRDHTYFYEKFIVALSCTFLPIVGFCIGIIDPRRRGGLAYFGMSFIVFLFYASVMLSQQLAARKITPPEIMLVLPVAFIASVTVVCLRWREKNPPSVTFFESLTASLKAIKHRIGLWRKVG